MSLNILLDANNFSIRILASLPGYGDNFKSPHQINLFVFSFFNNLLNISQKIKQKYPQQQININIIWDSRISLRKKLCPEYKANRNKLKTLEEEKDKINYYSLLDELRKALYLLGDWSNISLEGYEADDLIAYFIKKSTIDNQFIIISCDSDFYQLLGNRVIQYLPHKKVFYTYLEFKKEFGNLIPEKIIDIKALAGDNWDNIKVITGIGIKKAIKIIQQGQCWMSLVNKYTKDVDLEQNLELIKLPFREQEINLEMPKSYFKKEDWINLFQKFSLQKLNLKSFKDLLE